MATSVDRNEAEQYVLDCSKAGRTADFANQFQQPIRAEFLRELVIARLSDVAVAPIGFCLRSATIVGDLQFRRLASPADPLPSLDLSGSTIHGILDLEDSCWTSVTLAGCKLLDLMGKNLRLDGGLYARQLGLAARKLNLPNLRAGGDVEFDRLGRVDGPSGELVAASVNLANAKIGGSLRFLAAKLDDANGIALELEGVEINGDLRLEADGRLADDRFEAKGAVRLLGVRIGGQVACAGARFEALANRPALSMDGAEIAGGVFLCAQGHPDGHRFEATGTVRLSGAKVGGVVSCEGARFDAHRGDFALALDSAEVTGNVFLGARGRHRFDATGMVRLIGAKISGALYCRGATFNAGNASAAGNVTGTAANTANEPPDALRMNNVEVNGVVQFAEAADPAACHPFKVRGSIRLRDGRIGGLRCEGATLKDCVFDLTGTSIRRSIHVRLDQATDARIRLVGVHAAELDDNGGDGWGLSPDYYPPGRLQGTLLELDGFVYERFVSTGPVDVETWFRRARWLKRQYAGDSPSPKDFFPQPHEQLARVLRLAGHDYDARRIMLHKHEHEVHCRVNHWVRRSITWLFSRLFGCGYLPERAGMTVLAWWTLGSVLAALALWSPDIMIRTANGVEIVRSLGDPNSPPVAGAGTKAGNVVLPAMSTRDVRCNEIDPVLYALDTMLPFVDLHMEEKCEVSDDQPFYRWIKAAFAMLGWLIVTLAALTWSGVLRRVPT